MHLFANLAFQIVAHVVCQGMLSIVKKYAFFFRGGLRVYPSEIIHNDV